MSIPSLCVTTAAHTAKHPHIAHPKSPTRRHNRRLFRVARGLVWSDAKAEDVLQEGCVRAYARLGDHGRWASSRVLAASLCAAVAKFALLRATLAAAT